MSNEILKLNSIIYFEILIINSDNMISLIFKIITYMYIYNYNWYMFPLPTYVK